MKTDYVRVYFSYIEPRANAYLHITWAIIGML